ncbi:MAG: SCO family protein [Bacteroidetes bacterium]|nr:SCO family protein [Bacteroidota bacterium]
MLWRSAKLLVVFFGVVVMSCSTDRKPMPIFGERSFNGTDTVYHTIAPFKFFDQDSVLIKNDDVAGKVYVADFFFTSCRTICPKMKTQMKRVYAATESFDDFMILSHTIDPEYDNVRRLKKFADKLETDSKRWHFLTGNRDSIFNLAQTSYFATAMEDKNDPDGYIHSGAFLLIDRKGRIRGKYDGTVAEDVDRLIGDIKKLRLEE